MRPDMELPSDVKRALRALMLGELSSNTLDVFEIELFEWYVRETEKVLDEMSRAESSYIQEQVDAGDPEPNDSGLVAVDYHARRIRYSHIIYLTSLLETSLERACSTLSTAVGKENIPFRLRDLSGDQWSKRRNFLERYGRFELPADLWSKIQVLLQVRNYLVHENGSTANLDEGLRAQLGTCDGLGIDGYEFRIDDTYVKAAFVVVRSFVSAVEERVRKVIERTKHFVRPAV